MLNSNDIKIIKKLLQDEISSIKNDIKKIKSNFKTINSDVSKIRKDINGIITFFDNEYIELRNRVDKIEEYLKI